MMRHAGFGLVLSLLALGNGSLLAQPPGVGRALPVKAEGSGMTFFQHFVFQGDTAAFPGWSVGELVTGGQGVQRVKRLVAQQVEQTEYYYVLVYVNGQPVREQRARKVIKTIYVEVQEERQIILPLAAGHWKAIDLSLFSSWSIFHLGRDGLIVGAGVTVGESLYGGAVYVGVANIPTGWYQLTTGEPAGGGGGGGPPPEA